MKTTNHMNLGDPKMQRLPSRLDDLGDGYFECMRIAFSGAKGAELTRKNADVRIIDVAIQNISGAVPVFSFPNDIGDEPERINVCGAIEARCFLLVDPFSGHDLIADRAQFLQERAGYL